MNRKDLIKEMKDSIGTKDPIEYFEKMTNVLSLLFDQIDLLRDEVKKTSTITAAVSHWDPRLASDMISAEVQKLRNSTDDKSVWATEITALKQAYAEDKVTQSYEEFVKFWQSTLGFHPFLD